MRFTKENSGWGYDRIVGALANLGHPVSDQTMGNILRRYGIQPTPRMVKISERFLFQALAGALRDWGDDLKGGRSAMLRDVQTDP